MNVVLIVCGSLLGISLIIFFANVFWHKKRYDAKDDGVDFSSEGFNKSLSFNNDSDDLNKIVTCLDSKIKDYKYDYKK